MNIEKVTQKKIDIWRLHMKQDKFSKKHQDSERSSREDNSDKQRTIYSTGYRPSIFAQVLIMQKKLNGQEQLSETKSKNRV